MGTVQGRQGLYQSYRKEKSVKLHEIFLKMQSFVNWLFTTDAVTQI